jgi:hypothetical protein
VGEGVEPSAGERNAAKVAAAIAALSFALAAFYPLSSPDTFGHLAQGRQIVTLGHVPHVDHFSFWRAAPAPWRNYEWLSDVATWWLYDAVGPNALIATSSFIAALAALLLVGVAYRTAGTRAAIACAFLLVLALPAARFRLNVRPHMLGLPLAALYLLALGHLLRPQLSRARVRAIVVALFLAHVVWVNVHGSHLLGLAFALLHLLMAPAGVRARLGAALAALLLASCVSPFGPAIVLDAVAHLLQPSYRAIVAEWGGWQPHHPPWLVVAPLLQALLCAAVALPLWRSGSQGRALLACALLLLLAAARSLRFVGELLVLGAPVIAVGLAPWLARLRTRVLLMTASCAGALALPAVAWGASRLPPHQPIAGGVQTRSLPAATAVWLRREHPQPRLLGAFEDTWYLLYELPRARVLIDGRLPFYGVEHARAVQAAFADPRVLVAMLEHHAVDAVVVRHTYAPHRHVLSTLRGDPRWALASIEDRYALFVRANVQLTNGARVTPLPLQPGYEIEWLLATDAEARIQQGLARLPTHDNNRGYRAWIAAVRALRPLLRGAGHDGLRVATNDADTERMRKALPLLARSAKGAAGVPIVHALRALVAAHLCELDVADEALAQARRDVSSRESLLVAREIALRRGNTRAVRTFLDEAAALQQGPDPWLDDLRNQLDKPPRCP